MGLRLKNFFRGIKQKVDICKGTQIINTFENLKEQSNYKKDRKFSSLIIKTIERRVS